MAMGRETREVNSTCGSIVVLTIYISGSKLNLWINNCSILAAGKRAYSSQDTTFYLLSGASIVMLIIISVIIVDIDRKLSKN